VIKSYIKIKCKLDNQYMKPSRHKLKDIFKFILKMSLLITK